MQSHLHQRKKLPTLSMNAKQLLYSVTVQNWRVLCSYFSFRKSAEYQCLCVIVLDPVIRLLLKAVFDTWVGRVLWGCFVHSSLLGFLAVSLQRIHPFPVTTGMINICLHSSAVSSLLFSYPLHISWELWLSSFSVSSLLSLFSPRLYVEMRCLWCSTLL